MISRRPEDWYSTHSIGSGMGSNSARAAARACPAGVVAGHSIPSTDSAGIWVIAGTLLGRYFLSGGFFGGFFPGRRIIATRGLAPGSFCIRLPTGLSGRGRRSLRRFRWRLRERQPFVIGTRVIVGGFGFSLEQTLARDFHPVAHLAGHQVSEFRELGVVAGIVVQIIAYRQRALAEQTPQRGLAKGRADLGGKEIGNASTIIDRIQRRHILVALFGFLRGFGFGGFGLYPAIGPVVCCVQVLLIVRRINRFAVGRDSVFIKGAGLHLIFRRCPISLPDLAPRPAHQERVLISFVTFFGVRDVGFARVAHWLLFPVSLDLPCSSRRLCFRGPGVQCAST